MKKSLSIILALLFLLALVSCKNETAPENESSSQDEITYPIYTDLTLEHFKKLYVGMPIEDALNIVGAPHRTKNNTHYYILIDGNEYKISYINDAIENIRYFVGYVNLLQKTDLTMADINKLYIGMPFEDAREILGKPHRCIGSGFVRDVYKLTDGTEWAIYYGTYEKIEEIMELKSDN